MEKCCIDFKSDKEEGRTLGTFRIVGDCDSKECFIDFKLKYGGAKKGTLTVDISNKEVAITKQLRLCEQMGLYISLPCRTENYAIAFSEEVEVEEVIIRADKYNYCNLLEYASPETHKNQIKSYCDANRIGLSITWFVTWLCNYKCPFCWELVDESQYRKSLMKTNQISPQAWANAFNGLEPRELYLTGGEPTLYRKLPEVFEYLNKDIKLKMTSNFGPSFRLEEMTPYIKDKRFSVIGLSLHPSEVKINDFLAKMDRALADGYNDNCDLGIEMVLYPDDLVYVPELLKYCEDNKVKVILDYYHDSKERYVMPEDVRKLTDGYKRQADEINKLVRLSKNSYGSSMGFKYENFSANDEIVLYGAGNFGTKLLSEMKGSNIRCFADLYKAGSNVEGKEVLSPEMAVKKYPNAFYIITVQKRELIAETAIKLFELGVQKEQIKIYEAENVKTKRGFKRGKQPIWCPAGMSSLHVDPNGDAYPCMVALDGKKIYGEDAMPHYRSLGNILDGTNVLNKGPIPCWESYRCSACDYSILEETMYDMKLCKEGLYLPVPQ